MREFTKSMMSYTWVMTAFGVQQTLNLFTVPRRGQPHPATEAFNDVARATGEQLGGAMRATFRAGDNIQRGLVDLAFGVLTLGGFGQRGHGDRGDWTRASSGVGQQTADAFRQGMDAMGQTAQAFGAGAGAAAQAAGAAAQSTGWGPMPPVDAAGAGGERRRG